MTRHFDEELDRLKGRLLYMGGLVERMIGSAVEALFDRRPDGFEEVKRTEEEVNRLHVELDETCLKLLALHKPAAQELRFVASAMKINSDLERIADQAVNITQTLGYYLECPLVAPPREMETMARVAADMVKGSLDAFVKADAGLAREVMAKDDEVDACKRAVFNRIVEEMSEHPDRVKPGLNLILISRNLERIGDHATNIAEDVVYMVQGRDIRHHLEAVKP